MQDQPLNVTTSLEAHCRVVSQTHQAFIIRNRSYDRFAGGAAFREASRPTFGGRLTRSARFGDLTRLPVALLEASERTQQAQALGAQIDRPTKLVGGWEQKRHGVADVSATNGADAYLKFLHREIAAQRAFVRDIKNAKKNARKESQPTKLQGRKDLQGGGQPHAESAWHCVVSPVNPQVRVALEALISQQAWSLPGQQFAYLYSLGRAIQNRTVPARHHFDALVTRDAAREGALSPLGFAQRAFFCDKSSKLSEVIASPLGFGAVYQDMALLVALELRHAERLCWPEAATMTGRTIVTEIALGRCHTARSSLQGLAGAVPLARLQAEYQQGADSVYFPHLGIIAILSPSRALPVLLAEYSRKFVGVPTLTATK
ncbi:unnamed protein product [Durusdinium trenchii]|uniref:Uncharacterized protein n=1 Tax=Durusdinium trenchii TaxID=1381693 RepID=A0ABP0HJF1_9DINO